MRSSSNSTDAYLEIIVAKRFQLKYLLGKGAMGAVYYADDILQKDKNFAIKFLSQTLATENIKRRFAREAGIGAQLGKKSPHIVRVLAYGMHEDKIPFYVMEFIQGKSLKALLKEQAFSLSQFFLISRQICLGLQVAHQGVELKGQICPVIHRDLKPANILITYDAQGKEIVKILDFGIAKLLGDEAGLTRTGDFIGTLAYCSPEQMEGRSLDNRSDIYSLGVVMFEMLTGKSPWNAETTKSYGDWYKVHHSQPPRSFKTANANLRLPVALEELVNKCLAKKESDRPNTINQILKALDSIEQQLPKPSSVLQKQTSPTITLESKKPPADSDTLCSQACWPKNKPIAEIVFPSSIQTSRETLATLWVMLPLQQIEKIKNDLATPYNCNFLESMSPHPMLLWTTVLHSQQHEPRWLPCFLDLKSQHGQGMARLLATTGIYRVLFFTLEQPQHCSHVMKFILTPDVCASLHNWIELSQRLDVSSKPEEAKKILKAELEKARPKIMLKLSAELSRFSTKTTVSSQPHFSAKSLNLLNKISKKILNNFKW